MNIWMIMIMSIHGEGGRGLDLISLIFLIFSLRSGTLFFYSYSLRPPFF